MAFHVFNPALPGDWPANKHGLASWVPDLSNTNAPATLTSETFQASGASSVQW
jgi:hypothetical protein